MSTLWLLIIYGTPAIASLVLGITILINQHTNGLKRIYAAICFSIAAWSLLLLLTDMSAEGHWRLTLLRSAVLMGNFVPLLYVLFCLWFVGQRNRWLVGIGIGFAVLLTPFSYSDLMIVSIAPGVGAQPSQVGLLYALQALYAFVYFSLGGWVLIRGTRTDSTKRSQVLLMAIGFILSVTINVVTGFVLVLTDAGNMAGLVGPPTAMIFVLATYIAIARYRVFDVRPYIARVTAFVASVTLLVGVLLLTRAVIIFRFSDPVTRDIADALSLVALVGLYPYLLAGFRRATNRLFFRSYYEPAVELSRAADLLAYQTSPRDVLQKSAEFVYQVMHVSGVVVALEPGAHTPREKVQLGAIQANAAYLRRLTSAARAASGHWIAHEELAAIDAKFANLETVIPLGSDEEFVGILAIGLKKSGTPLDERDRRFLRVFAHSLSLASKNARNYQEITQFAEVLKAEVAQATAKLQRTNRRLKAVSVAQDEFVSMAAHQLRPQLSATQGFVDLLLRGGGGKVNSEQKKLLTFAHASVIRMIYLVGNILSASHSTRGGLVVERSRFNISNVVLQEIKSQQAIAAQPAVRFDHSGVQKNVWCVGDKAKLQEVILNLVDNAINYSPDNSVVQVVLSQAPDSADIRFTVTDQGIGVPPQAQKQLFTKFHRADNAREVRPTGTGIGLFVAQSIVQAHGGAMIFDSTVGQGSTFGFSLPQPH